MSEDVEAYVAAVPAAHRPLFDRVRGIVRATAPDAAESLAYGMPAYSVGRRRLYLGAWQHGVSLYGWRADDGGFGERHPDLRHGRGTIRLRPQDADAVPDQDLVALVRATLGG